MGSYERCRKGLRTKQVKDSNQDCVTKNEFVGKILFLGPLKTETKRRGF